MSRKQALLRGTFILTATGIATRLMGFFYRIFLSRTFHAEGVGLYQLIFPVYALCFSFTAAGIQVALSRIVASRISLHQEREAVLTLRVSLFLTVILSAAATLFLQHNARWIASELLSDKRCADLLVAMSWSFPFAAVHSCICGYYFGKKQTKVPAISQLLEQFVRIFSVWFFYKIGLHYSSEVHITIAVFGLVCGEVAAAAYSAWMLKRTITEHRGRFMEYFRPAGELLRLSVPLTANRVLLNILQSVEAVSIPMRLQSHGHTLSESLSIYGVLTGMALPCIMFPSAITNSVSTMLLPTVAEIQATADRGELKKLVQKVIISCFTLGIFCMLGFFILGNWIGTVIFHSPEAGKFILTMSFICPFLYTNTTLTSIINGLGKTTTSFFINTFGLLVRIGSVFFLIPMFGILGYLWGMLASQLVVTVWAMAVLARYLKK